MKFELVATTIRITKQQLKALQRMKYLSGKSESALVREAIDLLFKTPGKDTK